jgi:hypothetical protein
MNSVRTNNIAGAGTPSLYLMIPGKSRKVRGMGQKVLRTDIIPGRSCRSIYDGILKNEISLASMTQE